MKLAYQKVAIGRIFELDRYVCIGFVWKLKIDWSDQSSLSLWAASTG
ncbi:MAG: hypothetical protein U0491_02890 [Candidatus Saccharimonadales bacterium]